MNSGVIASRYAKAFLKFVQETGTGDKAYSQACVLALRMSEINQLHEFLMSETLDVEKKIDLVSAALGEAIVPELERFICLVSGHRRMEHLLRMLYSFIYQYRDANGIKVGRLISASPVMGLKERLEELLKMRTGAQVHLEASVNPELIGGFVFELDGLRLDASVESQFRRIRNELVEKNNRII